MSRGGWRKWKNTEKKFFVPIERKIKKFSEKNSIQTIVSYYRQSLGITIRCFPSKYCCRQRKLRKNTFFLWNFSYSSVDISVPHLNVSRPSICKSKWMGMAVHEIITCAWENSQKFPVCRRLLLMQACLKF